MKFILPAFLFVFGAPAFAAGPCLLLFSNGPDGLALKAEVRCVNGQTLYTKVVNTMFSSEKATQEKIAKLEADADRAMNALGHIQSETYSNTDTTYPVRVYSSLPERKLCLAWPAENRFKLGWRKISRVDCNDGVVKDVYMPLESYLNQEALQVVGTIRTDDNAVQWMILQKQF